MNNQVTPLRRPCDRTSGGRLPGLPFNPAAADARAQMTADPRFGQPTVTRCGG
ncbi:hypothetical protein Drose_26495 [Dactylosporangium roseum]|uniref:Uncharacterized protein n=1 Tax=Dactylosporangium roseum TaxID=47989 RepID=A0ABY5YYZ6_9ACTN|nr:hypothetical protein [Dactylosporangium roseum]UWZ34742.1 hypothetical protein Drose_26495 [Dactylosporangium roseum]